MAGECPHHARHEKHFEWMYSVLNGNGLPGTIAKANHAYNFAIKAEASKNGFLDWLFRAIVLIILGYIAKRVGC